MTQKLNDDQIKSNLSELSGWYQEDDSIKKEWIFDDFSAALRFINDIAKIAEKYDHHPEIFNVYNKVTLRYFTHTAGGLTDLDFIVAQEIDSLNL